MLAPSCPNLGTTVENGEVTYSQSPELSGRYKRNTIQPLLNVPLGIEVVTLLVKQILLGLIDCQIAQVSLSSIIIARVTNTKAISGYVCIPPPLPLTVHTCSHRLWQSSNSG